MPESKNLPKHVAIIMDGNGRWARSRGLPRLRGHQKGIESIREIITECTKLDHIEYLTLYAFSSENWKRPQKEVDFLMRLLKRFCRQELKTMVKNGVKFTTIGAVRGLPEDVRVVLDETGRVTKDGDKLTLCLALNYGSRGEIVRAVRKIAGKAASGKISPRTISEDDISAELDTAGMSEPDLVIRTAGEMRLSNFLLWQASYAELYFTDVLWPDFRREHLHEAIDDYTQRVRKFGGLGEDR